MADNDDIQLFDVAAITEQMLSRRGYGNRMQIPRVSKIVVNSGVNSTLGREAVEEARQTLETVTGQHPVQTQARKSVAGFKIREGFPVGARVTLRRRMMYNFLYRLVHIALPRVRDFRGISSDSFDGSGNYTFGLADQSVFPEINLDKAKYTIGMDITIVTTAETDDEARELLSLFGMPFAASSSES